MKKKNCSLFLLILSLLSSCLKETPLPISAEFTVEIQKENHTSPVIVTIENQSIGTDFYEWTFEGGVPEKSSKKDPGQVRFTEPGNHHITLRAWNSVEERTKEIVVRVDSVISIGFDFEILINNIAPAQVSIINKTKGGTTHEWQFKEGFPMVSSSISPVIINFSKGGKHEIHLKVFNGSEYVETSKTFVLQEPMQADFIYAPSSVDEDMEAPLTLQVENKTTSGLSYVWSCSGGFIANATAEDKTAIRFEEEGIYNIQLVADNKKEKKTVIKTITVKKNSGLLQISDLKFGINEAKNTVGCFFSSTCRKVLTLKDLTTSEIGKTIDIGFFALNSDFDYCYFFSPDAAKTSAFSDIPGAIKTAVVNMPTNYEISITEAQFNSIQQASDLDRFSLWSGNTSDFFTQRHQPHFVLFRTDDGRRGMIHIKSYTLDGANSYITADLKIEKRKDQ